MHTLSRFRWYTCVPLTHKCKQAMIPMRKCMFWEKRPLYLCKNASIDKPRSYICVKMQTLTLREAIPHVKMQTFDFGGGYPPWKNAEIENRLELSLRKNAVIGVFGSQRTVKMQKVAKAVGYICVKMQQKSKRCTVSARKCILLISKTLSPRKNAAIWKQ